MSAQVAATPARCFLFGFAAPMREASKVAAMWPAFRSKHFDEPVDGLVYASSAALGFACIENAITLRGHPLGWIWVARTAVALPRTSSRVHVGLRARAREDHQASRPALPGRVAHRDRRSRSLFAPRLWSWSWRARRHAAAPPGDGRRDVLRRRDLHARGQRSSRSSVLLERVSTLYVSGPPSLQTVRDVLRREGQPITLRWIVFGALVTVGAMTAGSQRRSPSALGARRFSLVDEHDVTPPRRSPCSRGLLAAFPFSGYSSRRPRTCRPPRAGAGVGPGHPVHARALGLAAPVALVFALAFSPIAWDCLRRAWVGRPAR